MLLKSRAPLRAAINPLLFFQRTMAQPLTAAGAKGQPTATGLWRRGRGLNDARMELYSLQCGYFYRFILTYPLAAFFYCRVKFGTKYTPIDNIQPIGHAA